MRPPPLSGNPTRILVMMPIAAPCYALSNLDEDDLLGWPSRSSEVVHAGSLRFEEPNRVDVPH
jgi:hypothetical protein